MRQKKAKALRRAAREAGVVEETPAFIQNAPRISEILERKKESKEGGRVFRFPNRAERRASMRGFRVRGKGFTKSPYKGRAGQRQRDEDRRQRRIEAEKAAREGIRRWREHREQTVAASESRRRPFPVDSRVTRFEP